MRFVRDIMHTKVVTVAPETPVHELVQTLARNRISGVPVVNDYGEILGVVSATDVMALNAFGAEAHIPEAFDNEEGAEDEETQWYFRETDRPPVLRDWDHVVSKYVVEDIMTPAAFSVDPDDSIPSLARFLLQGRIHRALVVQDHKLVGIVTTFDLLQAIAWADEWTDADVAMAGV